MTIQRNRRNRTILFMVLKQIRPAQPVVQDLTCMPHRQSPLEEYTTGY